MAKHVLAALAIATALLAPVTVQANAQERNLAFFLEALGLDAVPEGVATVHEGGVAREMPIADALRYAATRAGNVDVGALMSSATPGDGPMCIGDCWVFAVGNGDCSDVSSTVVPAPVPFVPVDSQLYVYGSAVGTATYTNLFYGFIMDWTTKSLGGSFVGGSVTIVGMSDFFCISFFGLTILFPYVDGIAYWEA